MSFYVYFLLGFLGGIPAGMGMGGGTVTIPLLTLVGGVEQKIAQCANLFSFLPMSGLALRTHKKNGLLKTEKLGFVIVPALLFSLLGSQVAVYTSNGILGKGFGAFLIGLSIAGLTRQLQEKKN